MDDEKMKEEVGKSVLTWSVDCVPAMDESLQNNGVFANINFEHFGGPAPHALNDIVWNASQGKRGSGTGLNGMAADIWDKDAG
jgi:hypothetical protein